MSFDLIPMLLLIALQLAGFLTMLLRPLIDGLFYFVQKDHCAQAWQWQRHLYKKE